MASPEVFIENCYEEIRIDLTYATVLSILILSLEFLIGGVPLGVLGLIQIAIFFAIAHLEDRVTVNLSLGWLAVRTLVAALLLATCLPTLATIQDKQTLTKLSSSWWGYPARDENQGWFIFYLVCAEGLESLLQVCAARIFLLAILILLTGLPILASWIVQALRRGTGPGQRVNEDEG